MNALRACPSPEHLRRLIADQLSGPERSAMETHVELCLSCQQVLEQLTAVSYSQEEPKRTDEGVGHSSPVTPPFLDAILHQAPRTDGSGHRRFRPASLREAAGAGETDEAWPELPGYDVVEVLGRGGMGVVYRARQQKLNRWVALKMLRGGKYAEPEQRARFQAEARAVAQLQHPNIVQIYEVGESEGLPYLVLELVEGGSLAQRAQDGPWPVDQAAQLLETLARTAHFAHQQGVIHRDLKPANILLESVVRSPWSVAQDSASSCYGPRTTDYGLIPKIADFGLAKQLAGDVNHTTTGFLVGTPGYMAPEQAEGRSQDVGPATDVHALGVILYELLTGRPPFQGASTLQTLEQVRRYEPVPPRSLQPRVPRDLETICLKCLHKESQRRYASAQDLADDLRRFRQGKPIQARPTGLVEQGWKWARRRPALAALLLLSTLVTLVGFPGVTLLWLRAEQERQAKEEQQQRADHEAQKALRQAYRGNLAAALASFSDHDVSNATQYLQAAPAALRNWEWRQLSSRLDDSLATIHIPEAKAIGLCPPGSGIVTAGNNQVRLWDALTGACLGTLTDDCSDRPAALATAKGPLLLVQSRERTHWRLYTSPLVMGSPGRVLTADLGRTAATFTADAEATRIAVTWFDLPGEPFFTLFELAEGNRRLDFRGHPSGIYSLAFSPDGTRIASGSEDGAVGIWDTATAKNLAFLHGHTQCVSALMFSPDGSRLVTGSYDGTIRQWDAHSGRPLDVRRGHKDRVYTVAYSPDGQWIASGSLDRTVRLWKTASESEPAVLVGHTEHVQQVAFSQDGRQLASVSLDQTARVWELVSRDAVCCLRGHADWINPVAYNREGTLIASGGGDKTVRLWDAVTGELLAVLPHPEWVSSLAFSPDGTWLVAGEWQGNLRIWNTATAQLEAAWISKGPPGIVKSVAVSPDGTRVVAVYDRWGFPVPTPQVWDRKTGQVVGILQGQSKGVLGVAYRPDGKQLASAGRDRTLRVWDAQTYEPTEVWRGHTLELNSVAYSADGRLLVSTSNDKTLRLWDVATGECRAVLRGHTDDVFTAVFHPDGTRIASTGRDRFIRFWDVATGEEVARFPGHTSWVYSLAFSPDGRTLASGSGDATIRLWDTVPLAQRLQARQQALAWRPEAERIVTRRFEELREPGQVVQALRADSQLSAVLRREALRAVLRRSLKEPR